MKSHHPDSDLRQNAPATDSCHTAVTESAVEQALSWFVYLEAEQQQPCEHPEFMQWLRHSPEHQHAWQKVQAMQSDMQQGLGMIPAQLSRDVITQASYQQQRRHVLTLLLGTGILSGLSLFYFRPSWLQGMTAQHQTRPGQTQTLSLPGIHIELNTATAFSTEFTAQQRIVRLFYGEIYIRTLASQDKRTLVVITADGSIEPLGTEFFIRRYPSDKTTRIQVTSGRIKARSAQSGAIKEIPAGKQTQLSPRGTSSVIPTAYNTGDWLNGTLKALRMPLSQVLDHIALYRSGWIQYDDSIRDIQVTGSFPLDDTDRILDALSETLPVSIHRRTAYWIRVTRQ